jgi:hypothetical protein
MSNMAGTNSILVVDVVDVVDKIVLVPRPKS